MGRLLVLAGLIVAALGLLIMAGLPIGRLPGDVVYRRGDATVYIPIVTSIAVSLLLTLLVMLWRR